MTEVKCPTCGKVLKYLKDDDPNIPKKKIAIHCNKCNQDIEVEC